MDFFVAFFAHYVNPQLQFFHFVHHKFRSFNIDFFFANEKTNRQITIWRFHDDVYIVYSIWWSLIRAFKDDINEIDPWQSFEEIVIKFCGLIESKFRVTQLLLFLQILWNESPLLFVIIEWGGLLLLTVLSTY